MRKSKKWFFVLGAAFLFGTAGKAQVLRPASPTANSNAAPTLTITGTVLDVSGAPAPGVLVSVVPGGAAANAQIKSDAAGKFAVRWQRRVTPPGFAASAPPQSLLVARDLEHNAAAAHPVDETTTNLDLRLQPGLTITAKIQEADGNPITNAMGTLSIFPGPAGAGALMTRTAVNTDDQGRVQFDALPQGCRYQVVIRAPNYGSPRMPVIQESQTRTTRLDLPPVVMKSASLKLAGRVLDADGQAVPAARVYISGVGQPATNTLTDAAGQFAFNVCEGLVMVTGLTTTAGGNVTAAGGDTNVVLRLAGSSSGATTAIALPKNSSAGAGTGAVTGTVFDPYDQPMPGVSLLVLPGGGPVQDITSDTGGRFAVPFQPLRFGSGTEPTGIQYLLVGRDVRHNLAAAAQIDEKTTNMDLHLQVGVALSGFVQDNNGAPVETATVRLQLAAAGMSSSLDRQPTKVDDQGSFAFEVLPKGQACGLVVEAPGFGTASVPVAAAAMQAAKLQMSPIKLKPADQRLEGKVVGPDDKPMAGVTVRINGTDQPSDSTRTDANGHFTLKVCVGKVRVMVSVPPGAATPQFLFGSAQAQGGDTNLLVKLAPRAAARGTSPAPPTQPRPAR